MAVKSLWVFLLLVLSVLMAPKSRALKQDGSPRLCIQEQGSSGRVGRAYILRQSDQGLRPELPSMTGSILFTKRDVLDLLIHEKVIRIDKN